MCVYLKILQLARWFIHVVSWQPEETSGLCKVTISINSKVKIKHALIIATQLGTDAWTKKQTKKKKKKKKTKQTNKQNKTKQKTKKKKKKNDEKGYFFQSWAVRSAVIV